MDSKFTKIIFLLAIFLLMRLDLFAKETTPTLAEIVRIEKRGKEIADYERATIRATDLLLASNPDRSTLGVYIAENKNKMWTVLFGKVLDRRFHSAYYFSCPEGQFDKMQPGGEFKNLSKEIFYFANALDIAIKKFAPKRKFPQYNPSVFREPDGTISVYLLPGNTEADIVLIGGDFKITVSEDASKVLKITELHKGYLRAPAKSSDGDIVAGFHTHILSDLPTETDVAMIILNPVLAPHYVTGKNWMSEIDANGKITILGRTEDILGDKN